ncbi:MAG: PAS domain S-box protein [Bacteroidales bacterium]|nr:PAS domain S-box protein [Bacteroidales bacterium]
MRLLFQTMVEGFALHEIVCNDKGIPVDYIFLEANPAFEMLTQLKRSEIIGKRVTEVLPGIEKEEFNWITRYGKVALTGQTDYFEDHSEALDKWYAVKVFSPEQGKFAVLFSDISERKKFETSIQASEEKFRTLFETMTQGVVYQNARGEIISANPAAERILGLSFDQMTGRTSMDSRWKSIREDGSDFPGEEHPAMVSLRTGKAIKDVIMGIFIPEIESYHWININSKPLFQKNETKPYQVYATFEDITFQRKAMQTIFEHKRNLELAQSLARMGSWEVDLKTGKSSCSEVFVKLVV